MKRAIGAAVAIVVIAAGIWLARSDRKPSPAGHARTSADDDDPGGAAFATESPAEALAKTPSRSVATSDASDGPRINRAYRDEMRKRIYEAIAQERTAPAPSAAPRDAGTMDDMNGEEMPNYIRHVIQTEYFPLAKQCYASALEKSPELEGRVTMDFNIVGDRKTGGIIESAEYLDAGEPPNPLEQDEEFHTCMRESLLSVTFDAPPGDRHEVSIHYPIEFSP